ncbi:MAG: YitT family protein [Oscillospiraceae bacterium]|mgnify:FL=1|nr:YitT family protein [Oscillospiraceae bacterium]
MRNVKKAWTYLVIAAVALLSAVNYELFVFPNQFAPSGLNGICTMIQYITGINVGYLSLIINVPLAIWCYIEVSKPVALRSMVYVVVFSVGLVLLDYVDLSMFAYATENGTSKILGPLVAGVIQGYVYSILMKASAYSGGIDFISAIIHKRHPNKSVLGMSFTINVFVAMGSFFVYDFKMEPVILCILYSFMSSTVGERVMKSGREAICFEIITDYPNEISQEIIRKLNHSTTLIPARGMYSGEEKNMLICVVNKTQAAAVTKILQKYPNTFGIMDPVSQVMGNFKKMADNGKEVKDLLDTGDGKTI